MHATSARTCKSDNYGIKVSEGTRLNPGSRFEPALPNRLCASAFPADKILVARVGGKSETDERLVNELTIKWLEQHARLACRCEFNLHVVASSSAYAFPDQWKGTDDSFAWKMIGWRDSALVGRAKRFAKRWRRFVESVWGFWKQFFKVCATFA